jgi:hypothetical protein
MRHDKPYAKGEISTYSLIIEDPAIKNYIVELRADHDYDIEAVTWKLRTGTCSGAFYILGSGEGGRFGRSVGGLDPISFTTTETESVASSPQRVTPGDRVTFSVYTISSPGDLSMSVRTKRA